MKTKAAVSICLLSACCQQPADIPFSDAAKVESNLAAVTSSAKPTKRFDPAAVDAARTSFLAEPKVRKVFFDPDSHVEWHIAVEDDGSKRYGFAGYFCLRLRQIGGYDENVDVRIIDAAKVAEFRDAYREYSLGGVQCKDEAQLW